MSANTADPRIAPRSKFFAMCRKDAERFLNDTKALNSLMEDVREKTSDLTGVVGTLKEMFDNLTVLRKVIQAYISGEYRNFSSHAMILSVTALLYFLNPFDLIADYIPVFGYLDDAAVLGFVIKSIGDERVEFEHHFLHGKEE